MKETTPVFQAVRASKGEDNSSLPKGTSPDSGQSLDQRLTELKQEVGRA